MISSSQGHWQRLHDEDRPAATGWRGNTLPPGGAHGGKDVPLAQLPRDAPGIFPARAVGLPTGVFAAGIGVGGREVDNAGEGRAPGYSAIHAGQTGGNFTIGGSSSSTAGAFARESCKERR